MAKYIKCAVCGEKFNIELIQGVKYNATRYAHYECYPKGELVPLSEDLVNRKILYDFVNDLLRPNTESFWTAFTRTANRLIENKGYTYSGMYKTLFWYMKVKNESINNVDTLFFVLNTCYEQAGEYFYTLYLINNENEKHIEYATPKQVTIEIKRPTPQDTSIKLFNLDD